MVHKHLRIDPPECPRSHRRKHCFHVTDGRHEGYAMQTISMECCHCQRIVIAMPTVFTVTKRG